MPCDDVFGRLRQMPPMRARVMEVCGTHTMAIARAGIRRMLPEGVTLLSGPGCPVCVTPAGVLDAALELAGQPGVVIATYGDMVRVPGSHPGDSLARRRARGAQVEVVFSPMDALALAERMPEKEVVFLGVGFETTAPGTAAAIREAARRGIRNFRVFSMLKRVEPALRSLLDAEGFDVQGFLCPGHVATILGERGFAFLPAEYGISGVIAGFEPQDVACALIRLLTCIRQGAPALENEYHRAVSHDGNALARAAIEQVFLPCSDRWRGLGEIAASGLKIRSEFSDHDAQQKFDLAPGPEPATACRCGEVMAGRLSPDRCPLFGRACTPDDPVGPCMVSSEGACAAQYKYAQF